MVLHFVDCFNEVKESFSALSLVRNFASNMVSWVQNGIILEVFEDVTVNAKLLSRIHVDFGKKRDQIS